MKETPHPREPRGENGGCVASFIAWMKGSTHPSIDRRVAELARRQDGVVEFRQLVALGMNRGAIEKRVRAGRLHPIHVGVYAVGHTRLSARGRRIGALLACGEGAVLSHQTAADHWNIRPSASPIIHVTVPTTAGRKRPGIRVHRTRRLRPQDVAVHDGLAVTSVARTVLDLATTCDVPQLRRAIERAMRINVYDHRAFLDLIPGRRTRRLRAALYLADPAHFRSELEADFMQLVKEHGLPRPEVNVLLHGFELDFLWRRDRLVVEVDSWDYHGGETPFEEDRARDRALVIEGLTVLRFTAADIVDRPGSVVADVRRMLR